MVPTSLVALPPQERWLLQVQGMNTRTTIISEAKIGLHTGRQSFATSSTLISRPLHLFPPSPPLPLPTGIPWAGCSSAGRESDLPLRQLGFPSAAGDFSPKVNFPCRLSFCLAYLRPPSPPPTRVQSRALTSERTLKIPSIGSHIFVWTQENTARTVSNG